jgi:2-polyprenyl-3-methyl-5-hydroxy-6-metoxy-1,4-benzoquinol methylase
VKNKLASDKCRQNKKEANSKSCFFDFNKNVFLDFLITTTEKETINLMKKKFDLVQRLEYIKDACRGKKVLHLGCTNYPYTVEAIESNALLHIELEKIAASVYGFDFDRKGIEILEKNGSKNLYQADLEKLEDVPLDETFDVIIAGEMIEHLDNPGLFMRGIKRFMNRETRLIITTINAYCGMRFWQYFLRGKNGANEPVHPDHVAYYSYSTLSLVIKRENLAIEDFLFYDVGREHRPHSRWYYKLANDISVRLAPQTADGIIAVCRLA